MVGHSQLRRPWQEAATSAFAVASALPVTMNSVQIAELFEKVEQGVSDLNCPISAELSTFRNATGESLLIVASRVGNVNVAKILIELDPESIDETDNEGWSPLLNAAHGGHCEIARFLLDNGATVDQPDLMGWSSFMWATYKNRLDIVELLLKYKAHVNIVGEEDSLTPLIIASGRGFSEIVEVLIAADCQVNSCDKFGSTALIWAARKGHLPVVQLLLNAGAQLDAVGMYSCTALMLAVRGNYRHVVDLLLTRDPNVNVIDTNGLSALGMAARDGYSDICESLILAKAYVSQVDKFGNWILLSAVRSGNAAIVRLLLENHADVDSQDSEGRTALHLAIDKSFTDIAYIILEKKPNLELKNKDGETALLRAAKCRHVHLCTYLLNSGAKLSATDNCGDNALHLAVRARSRRLTQALLANPSDSRLLYRPNKLGQTPYSIDLANPQPILTLIFGPIDAEEKLDNVLGYDVYANVLADILCEPSLSLPLTIGLYAKWGSGKSFLLGKLKDAMYSFSRDWLDRASLVLSFSLFLVIFVALGWISLTITMLIALTRSLYAYFVTWIVTFTLFIGIMVTIVIVSYGDRRGWYASMDMANFLARASCRARLIYNVITRHAPMNTEDNASMPVSFLFAEYHRLSSIGGEQALAKIVSTLFEAAETHFGVLPVRLFCSMKPPYPGHTTTVRRHCGIPHYILIVVALFLLILSQICLTIWFMSDDRDGTSVSLYMSICSFVIFLMFAAYPVVLAFRYCWSNIPRKRVNAAARNVHKIQFEGLMQKLQTEVDILADMIRSLDSFTHSHTRLVVVVDGLDNCEQERMVQTLDSLELLFSARKHRPFITIIAVDPHVIVTAISHKVNGALTGTELTGHDYLKNIINMQFFLHNSALRQLQSKLREKRESMADWKDRIKRQDTFYGSHLSLRDADGRQSRKKSALPGNMMSKGLAEHFFGEDYFSNMNPRAMRRILSAVTLTGRLMRAFEIDFSWLSLGHWVSLLEQWPSRMCWLIDRALEIHDNQTLLSEVYYQFRDHIPINDDLLIMDRNLDNFDYYLGSHSVASSERLTVGHVKKFVPCTSNLDPYLRKLIRERSKGILDIEAGSGMIVPANAKLLFTDELPWMTIDKPLVEMKLDSVVKLLKRLDVPAARLDNIVDKFYSLNLSGLVLATCPLSDLKEAMKLPLGDWTIVRLLIETLKGFGTTPPGLRIDKRRALTLREEDEEAEEAEEAAEAVILSERERAPLLGSANAEQRRRSTVVQNAQELSIDQKWLMENLSGMDLTETEGDRSDQHFSHFSSTEITSPLIDGSVPISVSAAPSVRFDDNVNDLEQEASDADSTQSRYDSKENLLEDRSSESPSRADLMRFDSTRSELMRGMHMNETIRGGAPGGSQETNNGVGSSASLVLSEEDVSQNTVQRRGGDADFERIQLEQLFKQKSDP